MTMLFNDSISPASSQDVQALGDRTRRLLILGIGLQVALALPSLIALFIDERVLNDISVWIKPLKFQASLILMLGTLLLLLVLKDAEDAGRARCLARKPDCRDHGERRDFLHHAAVSARAGFAFQRQHSFRGDGL